MKTINHFFPEKPIFDPVVLNNYQAHASFILPEGMIHIVDEDNDKDPGTLPVKLEKRKSLQEIESRITVNQYEHEILIQEENWHLLSANQVLKQLQTTEKGLSQEEYLKRIKTFGKNLITPPKKMHPIIKFLLHLTGGFQIFLWVGFLLCFIVFFLIYDYQTLALGIICILVVFITAVFDNMQEGKSDKVMEALKSMTPENVFVIREGLYQEVNVQSLVPGDICSVKSGDKVPADLRIIKSFDLKVNNSNLTGENVDIKLGVDALDENIYEAKNIARMGCHFTSGNGLGIVFATGDSTFFGKIAKNTMNIKRPDSCLKLELKRMVKIMGGVSIPIGLIFLGLSIYMGYNAIESMVFMIGIIVANVPEGLLPQLTLALTIIARRMQDKKVIVSNLEIIETLGATTVICSDKTGTLTCNRMTVNHIVYDQKIFISTISSKIEGDQFSDFNEKAPTFQFLQLIIALNTDAEFLTFSENVLFRKTKGDASESALIKFVDPIRSIQKFRKECPRIFAIPFNAINKWMLSIHDIEKEIGEKRLAVLLKGAPEKVQAMCKYIMIEGKSFPLNETLRKEIEENNSLLAKRGERVLGFAYSLLDEKFGKDYLFEADSVNFPIDSLIFVGFVSMIDPPRPNVKEAISNCQQAGIKVIMVTGDHPVTAQAIAKSLNLITRPTEEELKDLQEPV